MKYSSLILFLQRTSSLQIFPICLVSLRANPSPLIKLGLTDTNIHQHPPSSRYKIVLEKKGISPSSLIQTLKPVTIQDSRGTYARVTD
jgi:hypothetical protein